MLSPEYAAGIILLRIVHKFQVELMASASEINKITEMFPYLTQMLIRWRHKAHIWKQGTVRVR